MTRCMVGIIASLVVALGLSGLGYRPAAASSRHSPPLRAAGSANMQTVTLYSPALGGVTHVNILLPDDYTPGARHYPVLYLLAGHSGAYWQWATNTDVVSFTRGLPLIVVMPDGLGGWYSNPARGTGPRWEDYLIDDLIPYVDNHYRTITGRAGRAVAGLSMGGLGAFDVAARHPDIVVAAASFSGSLSLLGMQGVAWRTAFPDLAVFGNPSADALYWQGHDPVELASNLHGIRLYIASGDGRPGPFEPHGHDPNPDPGEQYARSSLLDMTTALRSAGITATIEDYGPGVHTWPYWQRDLHHAFPLILDAFAHPPAPPLPWSYRTIDDRFTVWGYHVARTGAPPAWTSLEDVSRFGVTAAGTGSLAITTAPLYPPGASYAIAIDGVPHGRARADATGRLRLHLTLFGPATSRHLSVGPSPRRRPLQRPRAS